MGASSSVSPMTTPPKHLRNNACQSSAPLMRCKHWTEGARPWSKQAAIVESERGTGASGDSDSGDSREEFCGRRGVQRDGGEVCCSRSFAAGGEASHGPVPRRLAPASVGRCARAARGVPRRTAAPTTTNTSHTGANRHARLRARPAPLPPSQSSRAVHMPP